MVSGTNHAKLYLRRFWPKIRAECHAAGEASPGISAPFDTADCGRGGKLPPSHCTQEKAGTNLASPDEKTPPHFSMPWALPISRSSNSL